MTTNTQVAEIVSFPLQPSVNDEAFLTTAAKTQPYISACTGFVSRQLSKGEDGIWTEYVVWDSMKDAMAAAEGFLKQDFAHELMGAIKKEDLTMRHQQILLQPT